jgi:acylphosphatase
MDRAASGYGNWFLDNWQHPPVRLYWSFARREHALPLIVANRSVGESKPTATERREVHYSGRVQGVGFRYTARDIAGRFSIRGFVKNLADGRVLLVAEGTGVVLDGFFAAIESEMDRFIENRHAIVRAATDEFSTFEILR